METTRQVPDPGSAGDKWLDNVRRLRHLILNDDPRKFLRWDVIGETMFVLDAPYLRTELQYLRSHDWDRWRQIIEEPGIGRPPRYPLHPKSSGNTIHHAYHLARFEEVSAARIADVDCILEFGGGYGNLCRLVHRMGFQGKYVVFDLPTFSALQRYYLRTAGIETVRYVSDIKKLREEIFSGNCLFIGTWSVSEAPVAIRDAVLGVAANFGNFLIAYQDRFEGVENVPFFDDLTRAINVRWRSEPIAHLPGNQYLFGTAIRNA